MKKFYQATVRNIKICASRKADIDKIADALLFVWEKDKKYWDRVRKIRSIIVHPKYDYDNELFRPEYIWICEEGTVRESTKAYLASLLVHEARHIVQHMRGVKNVDLRAEPAAYRDQMEFLEKYGEEYNANHIKKLYADKFWKSNEYVTKEGERYVSASSALEEFLEKYKENKIEITEITIDR